MLDLGAESMWAVHALTAEGARALPIGWVVTRRFGMFNESRDRRERTLQDRGVAAENDGGVADAMGEKFRALAGELNER